jgi:hypothetical protein
MTGSIPSFRSAKLVYQKSLSDPYNLEFLRIENTICSYLVLYSLSPSVKKEAPITLTINGTTHETVGQGSKRISLDTQTTHLIIESLKKNLAITIDMQGEVVIIEPSNFEKSLQHFLESKSVTEKMLDYIF